MHAVSDHITQQNTTVHHITFNVITQSYQMTASYTTVQCSHYQG